MSRAHRMRTIAVIGAIGAIGATTLVGCASSTPSADDNVVAACEALESLDAALSTASADLVEVETVGDVRAIREAVSSAYGQADAALDVVARDRAEALAEAWSAFADEAASITDESAVVDARDSLVEEANALAAARDSAESGLTCD